MVLKVKSIEIYFALFIMASALLCILAFADPFGTIKQSMHLYYLVHFILIICIVPFLREKMLFMLSPSFLTLFYSYFIFVVGGWAFNHGLVIWTNNLQAFEQWRYVNLMVSFNILCSTFVHLSYFLVKKNQLRGQTPYPMPKQKSALLIFLAIISFLVFSQIHVGILGAYNIVAKTLSALVIISILAINQSRGRYLYYCLILIVFAAFSFHDKREAVLLILAIIFMETVSSQRKMLSIRVIVLSILAVGLVLYLILAMSILRGYGGFNTTDFPTAMVKVPAYVTQGNFLPSFFQNVEATISFYHSHQAIEFIEGDGSLKTHGATIIKFLFVPLPRSLVDKPISIIEAYTGHYDRNAYDENVSWPILYFSELYWNFGFIGWFLVVPMFVIFNKLYFVLIRKIQEGRIIVALVFLFMYEYFLFYIRGSGLDLYFFYLILSSILFTVSYLIPYAFITSLLKTDSLDYDNR